MYQNRKKIFFLIASFWGEIRLIVIRITKKVLTFSPSLLITFSVGIFTKIFEGHAFDSHVYTDCVDTEDPHQYPIGI